MIDLEQDVKTVWNSSTKKYYEGLGYKFTKFGDELIVKAKDLPKKSTVIVHVQCDVGGEYYDIPYVSYNAVVDKNGIYICKSCTTKMRNDKKIDKQKFFQKFLDFCERNGYEPVSTFADYDTVKTKLKYICPLHGPKTITVDQIKDDNVGCRECSFKIISEKKKKSKEEIIAIVSNNGNKLLNPDEYVDVSTSNLKILCGGCNKVYTTSLASQTSHQGASCPQCGIKKVSKSLTLAPEYLIELYNSEKEVLLNPYEYINNSELNLKFVCPECGRTFTTSKSNYDSGKKRCDVCTKRKSSGEYLIEEFLKSHDIQFKSEYRFDDCRDEKPLPFDFYLEELNTIIEFDGQQHFEATYGWERLIKTKEHDLIKDIYCKENGIKLIRIPYWDGRNIDSILTNELKLNE